MRKILPALLLCPLLPLPADALEKADFLTAGGMGRGDFLVTASPDEGAGPAPRKAEKKEKIPPRPAGAGWNWDGVKGVWWRYAAPPHYAPPAFFPAPRPAFAPRFSGGGC